MKVKNWLKKTAVISICTILAMTGITTSVAAAETVTNDYIFRDEVLADAVYLEELLFAEGDPFYDFMLAIESLPEYDEENLIQKDIEAIAQYFSKELNVAITVEKDSLNLKNVFPNEVKTQSYSQPVDGPVIGIPKPTDPTIGTMAVTPGQVLSCIGALGTLIPVTKILKIKKVLKAAGGAYEVMRKVYMNYRHYRKDRKYTKKQAITQAVNDFSVKQKLSSGSKTLLMDFFSVSVIAGACTPLFSYKINEDQEYYVLEVDALQRYA